MDDGHETRAHFVVLKETISLAYLKWHRNTITVSLQKVSKGMSAFFSGVFMAFEVVFWEGKVGFARHIVNVVICGKK